MDIKGELKEKVDELVDKIKTDKGIAAKFKENPIKTVESLIGIDLPDEKLKGVVDAIKAKLDFDKIGDAFGGLKGLFGK